MGQIGACIFGSMKCSRCNQAKCIRKGKRNGRQRYYCKDCNHTFQESYRYNAYQPGINALLVRLLKEGCGVRSISRIATISKQTVLTRMVTMSNSLKPSPFSIPHRSYEIDELWTYIKTKTHAVWITYCLEKMTKKVVGFMVGSRSKDTIQPLIHRVLSLEPRRIYTDGLKLYLHIIPSEIHKVFQYCTNGIERTNLTLRTHIKRLSRRTICFSRKKEHLEAHLKIYFWG